MKVYSWIYLDTAPECVEIKTSSTIGSGGVLDVLMYTSQRDFAVRVVISFNSKIQYWIGLCTRSVTDFPGTLPTDVDQVWRIVLTRFSSIRVQIFCDNVEVLNILISGETCDDGEWRRWAKELMDNQGGWGKGMMFFASRDTASDFYRSCPPSNYIGPLIKLISNLDFIIFLNDADISNIEI